MVPLGGDNQLLRGSGTPPPARILGAGRLILRLDRICQNHPFFRSETSLLQVFATSSAGQSFFGSLFRKTYFLTEWELSFLPTPGVCFCFFFGCLDSGSSRQAILAF